MTLTQKEAYKNICKALDDVTLDYIYHLEYKYKRMLMYGRFVISLSFSVCLYQAYIYFYIDPSFKWLFLISIFCTLSGVWAYQKAKTGYKKVQALKLKNV